MSFDNEEDAPDLNKFSVLLVMAGIEVDKCEEALSAAWEYMNSQDRKELDNLYDEATTALYSVHACDGLMEGVDIHKERGVAGDVVPAVEYLYHNSLKSLISALGRLYENKPSPLKAVG